MKHKIIISAVWLMSLLLLQCTTESEIEPQPVADDPATSAASYADQFFTIALTASTESPVSFTLYGNGGKISINWGDGTIQKMNVPPRGVRLEYQYERSKNYTINISGDIKTITGYHTAYGYAKLNNIHFGGLVNLKDVSILIFGYSPEIINLSRNRALESVSLAELGKTKDILLPTTNAIHFLEIDGTPLGTAAIDRIVARVYDSVKNSPRTGLIGIAVSGTPEIGPDDEPIEQEPLGPPSSYTITKLRKLRDVYGWSVRPNVH